MANVSTNRPNELILELPPRCSAVATAVIGAIISIGLFHHIVFLVVVHRTHAPLVGSSHPHLVDWLDLIVRV